MKVKFTCHSCKKEGTFETRGARQQLMEAQVRLMSGPEERVYIITCQHCGSENRVRVRSGLQ